MLSTVEEIAQDMVGNLTEADKAFLLSDEFDFGMVGRQIRNFYGLWHDNPLTVGWRTNEAGRTIKDGVDFSPDHPDNISAAIKDRVIQLLKDENAH